jgi:hypothetical protein
VRQSPLKNIWATLWPHDGAGGSSRPLARGLGIDWKRTGRKVRPDPGDIIINWGRATRPAELLNDHAVIWNPWAEVEVAVNKLASLIALQDEGVCVPKFTTEKEVANGWVGAGYKVLGRSMLRASRGRGITLFSAPITEHYNAPLYVRYRKKKDEYRVHVFNGKVLDVQEKRRRVGETTEEEDRIRRRVRSWANGWVYARENVERHPDVLGQAIAAVSALNLTFGAVDIGWSGKKATVYEVNTAPALEGTTLANYIAAFKEALIERDR